MSEQLIDDESHFNPDTCVLCGKRCFWQPRDPNTRNHNPHRKRRFRFCGECPRQWAPDFRVAVVEVDAHPGTIPVDKDVAEAFPMVAAAMKAKRLIQEDVGLNMRQVSKLVGVAPSTITKWAEKFGWMETERG